MTPQELETFQRLGIKCVIDLRSEAENLRHPEPDLNMEVYRCSGVVSKGGEGIDFSPKGMNQIGEAGEKQLQVLTRYYEDMPFQNEAFQLMVKKIEAGSVPMCIHCATGKDRTGIAAMIILIMLGVDDETILEDYMLSCRYRQKVLQETLQKSAEKIKESPVLEQLLIMKDGVLEAIGRAVLKNMHDRYGSYEEYLHIEFGLTPEKLQELRDLYLI